MNVPDLIRGMVEAGYVRETITKEHGYTVQQWSRWITPGESRLLFASTEEAIQHYLARQVEQQWDDVMARNSSRDS